MNSNRIRSAALLLLLPALVQAQERVMQQAAQQQQARPLPGPAIQRIATASAVSTEQIGAINSVRELPDGRVLVNDGTRRRLLIMDTTMNTVEVVLDSLSEIANTYGTRPGALLPYRGDSTMFVDPASFAIVVLDPQGKMARVRSVWRVEHAPYFTNNSGMFGWPGVDGKGRIVYRVPARPAPPKVAPPRGVPYFPPEPDSAFIIAMNLETRLADTIGYIKTPRQDNRIRQMAGGGWSFEQVINPLPATDEWAILPDGTVAFVRWRDYRVEYLKPDGTRDLGQKLPFEWIRLTDEDKQRLVDSVKNVQQRQAMMQYVSQMIRWVNMYGKAYPDSFKVPEGYVPQPGFAKDWILPKGVTFPTSYIYACAPGQQPPDMNAAMGAAMQMMTMSEGRVNIQMGAPPPPPAGAATPGAAGPNASQPICLPAPVSMGGMVPPAPSIRQVHVIDPLDLPDYKPPIPTGSVRADMDGNLWIRITPPRPIPGGPVYDIVNRQGELVARYQTPPGYTIVGFGRDKVVYLSMRDAKGIHLARVRLR